MDVLNIWISLLALSVFFYVVLDGFDLGVGILLPFFSHPHDRDQMIAAIAPVWDGNETWLIFTGVCLFAVFPKAYAMLLPALYPLIIAMLLGLVFRGVAFEFREAGNRWKTLWDVAFHFGSFLVTFMQGVILGCLIQGIPNHDESAIAGINWLTPFSILTGVSVVTGYALMGAGWLIYKTRGTLQQTAKRASKITLFLTFGGLVMISLWTPWLDANYFHKWFDGKLLATSMMISIPLVSSLAAWTLLQSLKSRHHATPFLATIVLFAAGYAGVVYNLYPNIIPPSLSFEAAAAPHSSLVFLLPGTLVLLPLVLGYFIYSHWVFRGKVILEKETAQY